MLDDILCVYYFVNYKVFMCSKVRYRFNCEEFWGERERELCILFSVRYMLLRMCREKVDEF